jgi:hypothetical protein
MSFEEEVDTAVKAKIQACEAKAKEVLSKMQIQSDTRSGM